MRASYLIATLWSISVLVVGLGCGGGEENGASGTGTDSSGTGSSSTSGAGGGALTDQQVCQQACEDLILDCGVLYDSTCPGGCLVAPTFLACAKTSLGNCNALAMCPFEQACGAAAPSGTGTCKQAQDCQFSCVGSPDPNCPCTCMTGMSPAQALNLLRIDQCSTARCNFPCGMMGNQMDCAMCILSQCATENTTCQSN